MARPVLVIDDDDTSRRLVTAIFAVQGLEVAGASSGKEGLAHVAAERPSVVLLDMQMPEMNGLEVLEVLGERVPGLPVVMVTADDDVKTAVRATRLGAYDYLTKPIDPDELVAVVRRALETSALRAEVSDLRRKLSIGGGLAAQMGTSAAVREIVEHVAAVAASDLTVLVLGETG
ncbi:MAG: sigma-54-dependent Fis family transcriptional regulator, partial [Deltaproteobacteria bacterium]|nr:sigma-54-dependent Fis family transcriptional regulator [Deltaproteobacteria bacterium]